ncbi:MAG: Thioredoxin family protein, partial [Cyanobacteriota bacterium erpe_2018_sw_21hr_WHONDRS-SW48-000092_B_bin.40]|nr:Thioredoxin family protein [Cyanobacteriota bacterium erpe_2018_sw_21hr_WHONDRS-SW48-000092_B_bin.40]
MAFDDPSVAVKKEFVPEESQDKDRLSSEASEAFRAQSKSNARDQSRPSDLNGVTMVNRDDGTYLFDKQGRLFESASSDGKANIAYHYDDPENPNRIAKEVLNGKIETRYLGPVTVDGKPLTVDGHEVNGYSIFENGQLKGNWSGIRSVDKDGTRVIGSGFSSANEAAYQRCDASGQKLVAEAKPLNNMQAEKKASLFDLAANHSAALES